MNLKEMLDSALAVDGEERLAILRRAVERFPKEFEAWIALAQATIDFDPPTAAQALEQAERLPLGPDDLYTIALVWAEMERDQDAVRVVKRIADDEPGGSWEEWPGYVWLLGMIMWRRGALDQAEDMFRQSYDLSESPEAASALLDLLVEQKRYDDAEALLSELSDAVVSSAEIKAFQRRLPHLKRGRWVAREGLDGHWEQLG